MLKNVLGGALIVLAVAAAACAQEKGSSGSDAAKPAASTPAGPVPPLDRVNAAKQGTLKNPYKDDNADIVAQGQKLFMHSGCNGCHGGNGGGGMCPPLTNDTWVYGGDRATLYQSIYDGRRGLCPAWIGTLSFVQIRALAVYLHEASHHD